MTEIDAADIESRLNRMLVELNGSPEGLDDELRELTALARRLRSGRLIGRCEHAAGCIHLVGMRLAEAREMFRAARRTCERAGEWNLVTESIRLEAVTWSEAGRFLKAAEVHQECLVVAEEHGVTWNLDTIYGDIGCNHSRLGHLTESALWFRRALDAAKESGNQIAITSVLINSASACRELGLLDEARRQLLEASELLQRDRLESGYCLVRSLLCRVELQRGDLEAAEAYARQTAELASTLAQPRLDARAHSDELEIAMAHRDLTRARAALARLETVRGLSAEVDARIERYHGQILECDERFAEASGRFRAALDIARDAGERLLVRTLLRDLRRTMRMSGLFEEALNYSDELLDLEVELANGTNVLALDRLSSLLHEGEQERRRSEQRLRQRMMAEEVDRAARDGAAMALANAQLAESLEEVVRRLEQIAASADGGVRDELRAIGRTIRRQVSRREGWKRFVEAFESHDAGFVRGLRELAPSLTETEIRVAMLLRLGVATKQISEVLAVTDETITTYRYRLRRKLGLAAGDNLAVALRAI